MQYEMFDILLKQITKCSSKDVHNILVLRYLATPITPIVWRIGFGAENWVHGFTDHWTVRSGRRSSSKWIYFSVTDDIASMLLPDLYRDLELPDVMELVPVIDSTDKRVRSMLRWDLEDKPDIDEVVDSWDTTSINKCIPDFDDQYLSHFETEEVGETMRMGSRREELNVSYTEPEDAVPRLLEPRLSDKAILCLWSHPLEVRRATYMCEGTMLPLWPYEAKVIGNICEGRVTLTMRGV